MIASTFTFRMAIFMWIVSSFVLLGCVAGAQLTAAGKFETNTPRHDAESHQAHRPSSDFDQMAVQFPRGLSSIVDIHALTEPPRTNGASGGVLRNDLNLSNTCTRDDVYDADTSVNECDGRGRDDGNGHARK